MIGLCIFDHGTDTNSEPVRREAHIGLLCLHHRKHLSNVLVDVRELWTDLAFIDQAGSAPKEATEKTRHLKSPEAPAPANLEVLALRDNRTRYARIAPTAANPLGDQSEPLPPVMEMVASWVQLVAEERPMEPGLLPRSTVAQLQLLQRHGDWIAGQLWCDDLISEMGDVRKALSAALRDQRYREIGRCRLPVEDRPVCGGKLLQENGADAIICRGCGAQWVEPHERARLAMSLEAK